MAGMASRPFPIPERAFRRPRRPLPIALRGFSRCPGALSADIQAHGQKSPPGNKLPYSINHLTWGSRTPHRNKAIFCRESDAAAPKLATRPLAGENIASGYEKKPFRRYKKRPVAICPSPEMEWGTVPAGTVPHGFSGPCAVNRATLLTPPAVAPLPSRRYCSACRGSTRWRR